MNIFIILYEKPAEKKRRKKFKRGGILICYIINLFKIQVDKK